MFEKIISRFFRSRHYWRSASFDEIAELYASRLLTIFAINTVNIFAAVYLYKLGYSLLFIAVFYGGFYLIKIPFAVVAAKYAAFFGPKHGILLANILRIPSLVAFAMMPIAGHYTLLAIGLFGLFQNLSMTLYNICYLVDFSKVKHSEHAGKEIGMMQQIEKIARVASPLAGGIIASIWSPEVTIVIAAVLFAIAAVPLFKTVEPTMTRNKLRFAGFPWRLSLRSIVSESVVGFDFVASSLVWTLFVAATVFSTLGDSLYAALGGLASLGVLVSMATAWTFGRMIDRHHGDVLLVLGTIGNTVTHVLRPFIHSTTGVMMVNIASESATSAYVMPFTRVLFDIADSSGFRISYMMLVEMALDVGAALGCTVLAGCLMLWGDRGGMIGMFFVAAAYELIMLLATRASR